MTSNRRGQSQSALRAVQGRHEAIQKIERQMIELAQLFQDMEAAVIEQEPAVMDIEQKGEETVVNLGKGNEQLNTAVDKARSARKKKWICLGIVSMSSPNSPLACFDADFFSPHHYHHCCRCRHRCGGHEQPAEELSIHHSCTLTVPNSAYPLSHCSLGDMRHWQRLALAWKEDRMASHPSIDIIIFLDRHFTVPLFARSKAANGSGRELILLHGSHSCRINCCNKKLERIS